MPRRAFALARVDDRLAPRGPHGGIGAARVEGETRVDAARQIAQPDVGLPRSRVVEVEGELVAAGRKRRILVVALLEQSLELLARSVDPDHAIAGFARAVGEHAVARDGETSESDEVRADLLGQRDGLALCPERSRVEPLRHERPVFREEQIAGRRVREHRLRRGERLRLGGVERPDTIGAVLGFLVERHVEEAAPIGQELRPADLDLLARRL
jgi:hypothetical protein